MLVTSVVPQSPAQKAGIRSGDIIVLFNKIEVTTIEDLKGALDTTKIGATVELQVLRGKTRGYINVTIEGAR